MAKTYKDSAYIIGRIGAPQNLRSGGTMRSAQRKRDARRDRHATKLALRSGQEV